MRQYTSDGENSATIRMFERVLFCWDFYCLSSVVILEECRTWKVRLGACEPKSSRLFSFVGVKEKCAEPICRNAEMTNRNKNIIIHLNQNQNVPYCRVWLFISNSSDVQSLLILNCEWYKRHSFRLDCTHKSNAITTSEEIISIMDFDHEFLQSNT